MSGSLACVAAPPFIEATTRLASTRDSDGPYVVQSVVSDVLVDDAVELHYRVVGDPGFIPLLMVEDEDGERFSAGIPGRPAGTSIQYYVTVIRDGARVADDPAAAGAGPYQFDIRAPRAGVDRVRGPQERAALVKHSR